MSQSCLGTLVGWIRVDNNDLFLTQSKWDPKMLTAVATVGCCRSQSSGRPKVLSSKQQNFTLEGEARCVDLFLKSCPGIPWSHVPKLTCTSSVAPVVLILRTVYKLQFLCCSWHVLLQGLSVMFMLDSILQGSKVRAKPNMDTLRFYLQPQRKLAWNGFEKMQSVSKMLRYFHNQTRH